MIRADELEQRARRDRVRVEEIEKEYLQYAFLHSLGADPDGLVLRGGTMLRVAHGHPRYSEDLDFVRRHGPEGAEAAVDAAAADLAYWGIRMRLGEPTMGARTIVWDARLKGPLYARTRQENRIKVEVADSPLLMEPIVVVVQQRYPDVEPFALSTQDRRETTAEKVRALVERDVARDLYDLAFLIDQGHLPTPDLIEKKLGWATGDAPRPIRPHPESAYERDLRNWVPAAARLPWKAAWAKVRPFLEGLRAVRLPK